MSTERGMVNQTSEIQESTADLRRTARARRMAWARRGLVPRPADWPSSGPPAASLEVLSAPQHDRPGWSVNVEPIDRERLLRGWTQRELARRACIDQGTLSDLLARRRRPTLGTVQAICTALTLALAQVIAFDVKEA